MFIGNHSTTFDDLHLAREACAVEAYPGVARQRSLSKGLTTAAHQRPYTAERIGSGLPTIQSAPPLSSTGGLGGMCAIVPRSRAFAGWHFTRLPGARRRGRGWRRRPTPLFHEPATGIFSRIFGTRWLDSMVRNGRERVAPWSNRRCDLSSCSRTSPRPKSEQTRKMTLPRERRRARPRARLGSE